MLSFFLVFDDGNCFCPSVHATKKFLPRPWRICTKEWLPTRGESWVCLREAAAEEARFKVSQSVDELRETFTCWEGYYSWYFLFFLILYIVISWWISNESTCIIVIIIIMNHATWMIIFTASTSSSTTLEFRDSDFSVLVLCLCCWCDFCNGGWMVPCLSVGEKSHHHMVSMCRSNTEAIMTLTCQWLLLTNTTINQ